MKKKSTLQLNLSQCAVVSAHNVLQYIFVVLCFFERVSSFPTARAVNRRTVHFKNWLPLIVTRDAAKRVLQTNERLVSASLLQGWLHLKRPG